MMGAAATSHVERATERVIVWTICAISAAISVPVRNTTYRVAPLIQGAGIEWIAGLAQRAIPASWESA